MKFQFLPIYSGLFENYRYKVLHSGRLSGKTTHIILALLWLGSRHKLRIACLREYMRSLANSSKAEIELAIEKSGTASSWIITRETIKHIVTGTTFTFHGMHHNVESLKGLAQYDIAFIDEAETLSRKSWNFLDLTFRKQNAQIWVAGNPRTRQDVIAQIFIENDPPPKSLIIKNTYLDNSLLTQDALEKAEHIRDTDPERYNHELLGKYLDQSNLIMVRHIVKGIASELASDKTIVGCDIAKTGGDSTVIMVRRGRNIVEERVYPIMDLKKLAHELHDVYHKWKPQAVNIDSTGSGLWAGSGLESYGVKVTEINFASRAYEPDKYNNKRTEMYSLARKYFEGGGKIPSNAVALEQELQSSYYTYDNKNLIKMIPKTEIKEILGRSPDRADAFVLSLVTDGDMFYDDSASNYLDNAMLAKSVLNAGMF